MTEPRFPEIHFPTIGKKESIPILIALVSVIALVLVGTVLNFTQTVVIPLLVAYLLSQLLGPLVVFLVKHRVPLSVSVGLVLIFLIFILYWLWFLLSASTTSFLVKLPEYRTRLVFVSADIIDRLSTYFDSFGSADVNGEIKRQIEQFTGSLFGFASRVVGVLTNIVTKSVLIFVFLLFMLLGKPYGRNKIRKAFPASVADRVSFVVGSISRQISRYLMLQTLISMITGALVWAACSFLGVGSPLTWGVLAFFLNFIPTIGSIISSVPPILVSLLQNYPTLWPAVATFIIILLIQQIMGNFITPKLMGDLLDLSPVVVLVSLVFWGWLWGFVGALLSIIIAAAIKIICENIAFLYPISVLMSSGKR